MDVVARNRHISLIAKSGSFKLPSSLTENAGDHGVIESFMLKSINTMLKDIEKSAKQLARMYFKAYWINYSKKNDAHLNLDFKD